MPRSHTNLCRWQSLLRLSRRAAWGALKPWPAARRGSARQAGLAATPLSERGGSANVNLAHPSLKERLLTAARSQKGSAEPALPAVAALSFTDRSFTACMHIQAADCHVMVEAECRDAMMTCVDTHMGSHALSKDHLQLPRLCADMHWGPGTCLGLARTASGS